MPDTTKDIRVGRYVCEEHGVAGRAVKDDVEENELVEDVLVVGDAVERLLVRCHRGCGSQGNRCR